MGKFVMGILKQGSYHLLIIIAALLGMGGAAVVFFFGVGYIDLGWLFAAILTAYMGIAMTTGYVINRLYRPARRQLLITNAVMSLFAVVVGISFGRLLVG